MSRRLVIIPALLASMLSLALLAQNSQPQLIGENASRIVVSGRKGRLVVDLASHSGTFVPYNNTLCVLFHDRTTTTPIETHNVSVEFRQLVGRIQEVPIAADLRRENPGVYCGHVDLGRQYYVPSSYYVFVRFVTLDGRQRSVRLFISVK